LDIRWPDVEEEDVTPAAEGEDAEGANAKASPEDAAAGVPQFDQEDNEAESRVGDLPMSVQGAYASFIGKDSLTLERYSVYAGLKRAGYIVQRAPTWHDTDPPQGNGHGDDIVPSPTALIPTTPPSSLSSNTCPPRGISNIATIIHKLVSYLFHPQRGESCPSLGPLVAPGLYRNYTDLFRALALIPYHDASSTTTTNSSQAQNQSQTPQAPYRIHFHVWKPATSSTYKKTSPPPPDYRICVIDARTTPSIPSLSQIGPLLDSQQDDSLTRDKASRLETRIRHGKRNVLLAVVDMGVISYLRLSDACFGAEKLFEEKARTGTKGRGRRPQGHNQPRKPGQTRST
jgi:tRNA-splicing endonuclease subunit Sen54